MCCFLVLIILRHALQPPPLLLPSLRNSSIPRLRHSPKDFYSTTIRPRREPWKPPFASLHPRWLPSTRTSPLSDPPPSSPSHLFPPPAIRPSPLAGLVALSLFVEEQRKSLGSVLACLPPLSRSSETHVMPDIMAERCRETSKQPGPQVSPASQESCPGAAGRHVRGEHALVGLCLYGHQAAKLCEESSAA